MAPAVQTALTAGKLRGLTTLADGRGAFAMVALDQRPPIFQALARAGDRRPDQVADDEVARVKTALARALAPHASAVLLDPVWGLPHALRAVPGRTGLMVTLEDHAFEEAAGERRSREIPGWSVAKIKRCGAAGVKLLAWDRPDASEATRAAQEALVARVGAACREHDLPFVLELLLYPLPGEDPNSLAYARAKPERVLRSVRRFADERFGVDLFKLELPADLRRARGAGAAEARGGGLEPAYDLSEVRGILAALDEASPAPWVLLSAGVAPDEFEEGLALALEAGASGFLAGRAVWLDALDAYPDLEAVRARLEAESAPYLRRISALTEKALPWTEHRRFGGAPELAEGGAGWHERYGS